MMESKTFVVTGASSGIGKSTALMLINSGNKVVAIGRSVDKLEYLKSEANFSENLYIEIKDLAEDIPHLPQYMKYLAERYGKFDGVVHCAGAIDLSPLRVLDVDTLNKILEINFYVPVMLTKGFADKKCNSGDGAAVVFVSSLAAELSDKSMLAYSSSKAALNSAAKVIAKELQQTGIRVNTVSPSDIDTDMLRSMEGIRESRLNKYPWGFGKAEDVANLISYLLSDKSRWITGQNYVIDCGSI